MKDDGIYSVQTGCSLVQLKSPARSVVQTTFVGRSSNFEQKKGQMEEDLMEMEPSIIMYLYCVLRIKSSLVGYLCSAEFSIMIHKR